MDAALDLVELVVADSSTGASISLANVVRQVFDGKAEADLFDVSFQPVAPMAAIASSTIRTKSAPPFSEGVAELDGDLDEEVDS